ncbi:MAG: Zn-dependent exopeptidase M28 [Spirochaetaceae bacterium]|jgi:hypothetical protein|nr:Zn-dependent exopeptidase M28 [Spirochaetaceae bacterium]
MTTLPDSFSDFLENGCDRCRFILDRLAVRGITGQIVTLGMQRHIVVQFAPRFYNPLFKLKTVITHYDRVFGSPGANDNSAAVFQIIDWVERLNKARRFHNVRIFFTDGEELGGEEGVREQGAFGIASRFKALGILNDDVYVFDCCGRGDVFVLSATGVRNAGNQAFNHRFTGLYHRTEDLLRLAAPDRWVSVPVPYSDNAGFLACGIPAVAITLLPAPEVSAYLGELRRDKKLETDMLNHDMKAQERLPETWRLLHTPEDNAGSLTPKSFAHMARLLDTLTIQKDLR